MILGPIDEWFYGLSPNFVRNCNLIWSYFFLQQKAERVAMKRKKDVIVYTIPHYYS